MSVDKFGRHLNESEYRFFEENKNQSVIPITNTGDYNFENKRITNIQLPKDSKDATTKYFVENKIDLLKLDLFKQINLEVEKKLVTVKEEFNNYRTECLKQVDLKVNTFKENLSRILRNESYDFQQDSIKQINKNVSTQIEKKVNELKDNITKYGKDIYKPPVVIKPNEIKNKTSNLKNEIKKESKPINKQEPVKKKQKVN